MAIGTKTDFTIYQEQTHTGMLDKLTQFTGVFNEGSNNAVRMDFANLMGEYNRESFFKRISGFIERRDNTSTSAVATIKFETDEYVGIKVNRRAGPVAQTLDAWKKMGKSPQEMSYLFGQLYAEEKIKDMLDTGLASVVSAITAFGAGVGYIDSTTASTTTLTMGKMNAGLKLMGDAHRDVVCWVGHSIPYFDLVGEQIAGNILDITGSVIVNASPQTLMRPYVYTDSSSLMNGADEYYTLGLVENAVKITQSEPDTIVAETKTGYESIYGVVQGEYTYTIEVNGFKWDVANGGVNPALATIKTSTNWDKAGSSSVKTGCGIYLLTK